MSFLYSSFVYLVLATLLAGCSTPFLARTPNGPPKYPITRETFRQVGVQWVNTDDDYASDCLVVFQNRQLEAGVRTREARRETVKFQISTETLDRLLATLNRVQLRRETALHLGKPRLNVTINTSDGSLLNDEGNFPGSQAAQIAAFFDKHLWPEVRQRVRAKGLTPMPSAEHQKR